MEKTLYLLWRLRWKEDSDDDVFEAKEEMDEDIKEPEPEETQTHHSPKHTNKEEHQSSSPNKDQPESSIAKKTNVSDSESSSCSKSLKPYNTTCQSLIGNWSMFKREKLSGSNFNDRFRQLKMVLRVEKKLFVVEQPLPAAPAAATEAQFENSSPYDMIKELKSMFDKQARVERFDLILIFHTCKQEDGKLVSLYVLKIKRYVEQLERLGYVLPQDLSVGLIIASLHPAKNDACHHCKEVGHCKRNYPAYLAELIKKKKQVGTVFKNEVGNQLGKTIKALRSDRGGEYISQEFKDYLKDCGNVQKLTPPYTPQHNETATRILNMVPTKKVDKTPYELWYVKVPNLSYLKIWGCEALVKRDTPDKLQQRSVKCIFIGYLKEMMSYYFYFPPENKIVVARTHRAPDCLCLNVEVEEYSLGDLNEPTNYKAALLDLESDNWVDAMNAEMQSMKDNQVWCLVDLPPNSKGFTQTYGVDYEETFSPVADIRAIRIPIAIAAFYDYEIWQTDVKTSFLNGYLDDDIYMV
ncbi:retrotransposon protein, putative, ty1-copia subclass [Tanacetum coccineum]